MAPPPLFLAQEIRVEIMLRTLDAEANETVRRTLQGSQPQPEKPIIAGTPVGFAWSTTGAAIDDEE